MNDTKNRAVLSIKKTPAVVEPEPVQLSPTQQASTARPHTHQKPKELSPAFKCLQGVASENGKNRTVSRGHGLASRKRSFLRGACEKPTYASAGIETCFLENHSRM